MKFSFLKTKKIRDWTDAIRKEGIKEFVREKGKAALILFILLYLIRDLILYVLIPYLVTTGVISAWTD